MTGLALAREQAPDVIMVDRRPPELDGLSRDRLLRRTSHTPIILKTGRETSDGHARLT